MTHEEALQLLNTYGKAWVTKNPELLDEVFTEDVIYNDPREPENIGRDALKAYWKYKVLDGQDEITFDLQYVWIEGSTVIAEWHATFKDLKRQLFIDMFEVAICETRDGKFSSLREYYKNTKTPL